MKTSVDKDLSEILNINASSSLCSFKEATVDEIISLISKSSNAYCNLDPIPTNLVKLCSANLAPFLVKIVNMSLNTSIFPSIMKQAIVKPLLKKSGLDINDLKNYRPVSNLSFISKLCERIVANPLDDYLVVNNLVEKFQSAYRRFHSTETALLRVHNDILSSLNEKKMVALVLPDLSAAFDTLNHNILLKRLSTRFGIKDRALRWIQSYLKDRTQRVTVAGIESHPIKLDIGVPQGSVLGPLLFTLYTSSLADVIRQYNVQGRRAKIIFLGGGVSGDCPKDYLSGAPLSVGAERTENFEK